MVYEYSLYEEQIMSDLKRKRMQKTSEMERINRQALALHKKEEKNIFTFLRNRTGNNLPDSA